MLFMCFYVPESHLDAVKSAAFAAGGGRIDDYENCSWQVKGEGQFRPMEGSQPFIGKIDRLEIVEEYKVEMVVPEDRVVEVVAAMKAAHPYEEPAYHVIKIEDY